MVLTYIYHSQFRLISMKTAVHTFLLFLVFTISQQSFAQGEQLFQDSLVHEIRLNFEDDNFWTTLRNNYDNFYPDIPYILADATIDGNQVDSIGVRLKGFSSAFISTDKKSIKLDFNEFVQGKKYDGLRKVNVNNGEADPAIQRDILSYNMFREIGIPAPRTAYTKVFLNDEYWGLYLLVEQVDKTFLKENFGDSKGNLFKNVGFSNLEWLGPNISNYQGTFDLKTDPEPGAWERFVNLMNVINNSSDANFKEDISEIFDVDHYLKVLAVDVVTGNWDSYLDHGRNFYLYEDSLSQKFKWIPWDYNLSMGGQFSGMPGTNPPSTPDSCQTVLNGASPYPPTDSTFLQVIALDPFCCEVDWDGQCQTLYDQLYLDPGNQGNANYEQFPVDISGSEKVLISRLLEVPDFQERYYQHWCGLIENNFTEERLFPLIDFYGNLAREDITNDDNYPWPIENFEQDLDQGNNFVVGLKKYITTERMRFQEELDIVYNCSEQVSLLSRNDLVINEFSASSDSLSGLPDPSGDYDDWIELYNNTNASINLSNTYLTDNPDNIKKWQFPLGTTIEAGGYLIVWADENGSQPGLHANFKLARQGEFIQLTDFDTVLDSLTYGEQMVNLPMARIPNGNGSFIPQDATFGFNNETTTSIQTTLLPSFKVFPNPAGDHFNIALPSNPEAGTRLTLYNGIGQVVLRRNLSEIKTHIYIPNLPKGNYFLRVEGFIVKNLQVY